MSAPGKVQFKNIKGYINGSPWQTSPPWFRRSTKAVLPMEIPNSGIESAFHLPVLSIKSLLGFLLQNLDVVNVCPVVAGYGKGGPCDFFDIGSLFGDFENAGYLCPLRISLT